MTPQLILKPKRAQPFYGRHPWVFAGAVDRIEGNPKDGDEILLKSSADHFVARGLYNSQSKIVARLYTWQEEQPLDEEFFRNRIRDAIRLRHNILKLNRGPAPAYRLIFSESDILSGLIVDRYGGWLAMQCTALVMGIRREMLAKILTEELQPRGIVLRTEKGIGKLEGLDLRDGLLCGQAPQEDIIVDEDGLQFAINLNEGQKTGFYLDQRDNRRVAASFCEGRRVLDAFCYSGGFGLHAAKAGAASVVCVDASAGALELARKNAELNGLSGISFEKSDVFQFLQSQVETGQQFDVMVLDPPKFARNRAAIPDALKGYRRLHQFALQLLPRDGVLVSCCCTGLIAMTELEDVIQQAAQKSNREIQILERRGPSADHPTAITCRESNYLKCIISRALS